MELRWLDAAVYFSVILSYTSHLLTAVFRWEDSHPTAVHKGFERGAKNNKYRHQLRSDKYRRIM